MIHSKTTVSNLLNELQLAGNDIDACLLIGEKVSMIHEAGLIYNQLRQLVTPEYFTDDEYEWIKTLGHGWNDELQHYHYHESAGGVHENGHNENFDALENQIRDALENLMGEYYDLGLDGEENEDDTE
mgnify:CR=1 FL=1|tara:strand:+ start:1241 stop:1624 length:384 start_codon:yes stop_codon:yes gene_type:complete